MSTECKGLDRQRRALIVGYTTLKQAVEKGILAIDPPSMRLWYNPGGNLELVWVFVPFGNEDLVQELPENVVYEEWSFTPKSRHLRLISAALHLRRARKHTRRLVSEKCLDVARFNGPHIGAAVGIRLRRSAWIPQAMFIEAFWEELLKHQSYIPRSFRPLMLLWYRVVYRSFDSYCGTPSVSPGYFTAKGMKLEAIADWTHEVTTDALHEVTTVPGLAQKENPQASLRLSYVGRLHREKKVDDIVSAFAQVHSQHKDSELVLVGDGPLRTTLEESVKRLGLQDSVRFFGSLSRGQGMYVVSTSDIYIATMQGNALVEALLLGVPVIAYDNLWHRRLIKHGVNGVLVPDDHPSELSETILALALDHKRMNLLSDGARSWGYENCQPAKIGSRLFDSFVVAERQFRKRATKR